MPCSVGIRVRNNIVPFTQVRRLLERLRASVEVNVKWAVPVLSEVSRDADEQPARIETPTVEVRYEVVLVKRSRHAALRNPCL